MRDYFFSKPSGWPEVIYRLLLAALIIGGFVVLRRGQIKQDARIEQVATVVATLEP